MTKHRAAGRHHQPRPALWRDGVDALALFPASPMKSALEQVVAFCLARSY